MSMPRLSIREYRLLYRGGNKYAANAIVVDGQRFDSKLEARRYLELKQLRRIGAIDFFLRQVPFHLPGGIIYRLDFLVRWPASYTAEPVTYEDCKGMMTRVSQNKIKQVEALYGIEVRVLTKKDVR
jgi:hypothetical protein